MAKSVEYDRLEAIVLARQYKSKTNFRLENKALYSYAHKHGWWPEMSAYMDQRSYPVKWTEESVRAEALKFSEKKDFQRLASGAYAAARKMGIVIDVCSHMKRRLLPEERANGRNCSICGLFTKPGDIAGESAQCRKCHSARTSKHAKDNPAWKASTVAKRRARLARAIPPWVDDDGMKAIQSFYKKARALEKQTGIPHEVDHIYPIAGKTVCGLHVPENLQVITKSENRRKSNKYHV
jgi:hypothetical protein